MAAAQHHTHTYPSHVTLLVQQWNDNDAIDYGALSLHAWAKPVMMLIWPKRQLITATVSTDHHRCRLGNLQ
jgi:hypothetical protein